MTVFVLAIVVLGLICGSELNVAAFGHPTLNRQSMDVHIPVRASFATLFGRVMPFWMATSALLNLLLLLPFEHLGVLAGHLAQMAFVIQVVAILFSLVGPVPINNRVKLWTPRRLEGAGASLGPLPLGPHLRSHPRLHSAGSERVALSRGPARAAVSPQTAI